MKLQKLRHAVVLARVMNFTKAADALNISQSALSRSIQALEDECQQRLFDRNRNKVAITQFGRDFVRQAETLLRNEADLVSMVEHAARGEGGRIAIGMAPLAARTLLAPLMIEMIGERRLQAEVTIDVPKRMLSMVLDESIDLCVCTGQSMPSNSPFLAIRLARFPIAFIVRKGHPLTQRDKLNPEDVEAYPILRTRPQDYTEGATDIQGVTSATPPTVTVEDYDVLMQIIAESDAVWTTSPAAARERIIAGSLVQLPISWLPETPYLDMTAYVLAGRTPSSIAQRVMTRLVSLSGELSRSFDWIA
jgi:DNA-binding transcriptional LysR family regulator